VDSIARHNAEVAGRMDETARCQAEIADAATMKASAAEDIVKITTTSLDLATDCLRLLMHFFYPIQQSSQQVYHTALPLSPTLSPLPKSCLQNVADNHLSLVTAFSGAPDTWGLLLRTIDVRQRKLTCIATSAQRIIAACEDVVEIYDAVTFVLRQSLRAPETVTKILGSPDGSTLFFAHSHSVTMWDIQTGGLIHAFITQSEITDIAVSKPGEHIACGSSDGSVAFWNTLTKKKGKGFGSTQPVVTICWLSPAEFAVATHGTVCIHDITAHRISVSFSMPGRVWGMVYSPLARMVYSQLAHKGELLVGVSQPGGGARREPSPLKFIKLTGGRPWRLSPKEVVLERQPWMDLGLPPSPTLLGAEIVCITPPSGVQSFNLRSLERTWNPPLLDAATSVAVSLNRNLAAQTKDSIQIFSLDVLKSDTARSNVRPYHIYPLGENHIVCLLQPTRCLIVLDSDTLQQLDPPGETWWPPSMNKPPHTYALSSRGFVAEFGISAVIEAWQSHSPLPEWTETTDEDPPLSGLSPSCTRIVTLCGSPRRELRVKDAKNGTVLANLLRGDDDLEIGVVYDVTFDSEVRFHLKIDGPGRHVQIPYDITPSPSGFHSHTITKGELIPLSDLRATPTYTLDTNCEWVVDAESRKICWISPGNVRKGNGGHFWAGLSLVMVGDDGVVRKLTFREPDS
jgi:WD40 repeat protein